MADLGEWIRSGRTITDGSGQGSGSGTDRDADHREVDTGWQVGVAAGLEPRDGWGRARAGDRGLLSEQVRQKCRTTRSTVDGRGERGNAMRLSWSG